MLTRERFGEKISANVTNEGEEGVDILIRRVKKEDNDNEHHIYLNVQCYQTKCEFEITVFEYKGPLSEERGPNLPPGAITYDDDMQQPSSPVAGNIALIIPARMTSQLDQGQIQQFIDGHAAIQLFARVPDNPIQFIQPLPGLFKEQFLQIPHTMEVYNYSSTL